MRASQQRDDDVRTIIRDATRRDVTIIGLCWDWPLSLRRVLEAVGTALVRGWLVDAGGGVYRAP